MTNLFQRSIEIILENQSTTGAYIASPNFATYRHCWFRDGSFIAYAMNRVGRHESAARFHDWAAAAVNARTGVVEQAVAKARRGEPLSGGDFLHTRYALSGGDIVGEEEWPNYQLDGFGTWLWALEQHRQLSGGALASDWLRAASLAADYLKVLWPRPCYDCWEEFPDRIHPYTLAAIHAGLRAYARLGGVGVNHRAALGEIARFLRERAIVDGRFVKFVGSHEVDASLLGLAVPYGFVGAADPLMRATVKQIETDLRRGGGLHRYAADTYYGGGEWVLLTAWLGWYYAASGEREKAESAKQWIEAQADSRGYLPEQVPATLNDTTFYDRWRGRWGEIASPLLWSHAKYIILSLQCGAP